MIKDKFKSGTTSNFNLMAPCGSFTANGPLLTLLLLVASGVSIMASKGTTWPLFGKP